MGGRRRSSRTGWIALAGAVVLTVAVVGTPGPGHDEAGAAAAAPTAAGTLTFGGPRLDATAWRARQDAFLAYATSTPMNPGSVGSILAHGERHRRDPSFPFDGTIPKVADLQPVFTKLQQFRDTGDFDVADLLNLWQRDRDQLDPTLRAAIEERLLAFKYWWTEPTPPGIVDSQYYWTENHLILFLANEYVAGQAFPDRTFTNSGMTGAQHKAHAEPLIRYWLGLRARFGFSEWLSNVYYGEDLEALLLLAEHADDPALASEAAKMLDVLFVEMASHLQNGAFGATHGRSYMKDKMTARDEDVFTLNTMVFDDTAIPFGHVDVATPFAIAGRYAPPQAAVNIAQSDEVGVVRQHQSQPMDVDGPVTPNPTPPNGLPYDQPMVWWAMGGQFSWPVVPLSIDLINRYSLWDTENFQQAAGLRPIVDGATIEQLQQLSASLGKQLNSGLLSEVNTTTWRSPDVMLSSAQDWRPGERSEQAHIWQATIDADAQVFTTNPNEPLPQTTNWFTNSGYWTGEGAAPRTAQVDNVGISIYTPGYDAADTGPLARLSYLPFTHAYFPTEHFDQVVQAGGWTIGRKGNGYVALWSWRPTQWRVYDPATEPTRGLTGPFDLLAPGGPDNVWITEVGRAADWAGAPDPFQAFVQAVTTAPVSVTPRAPAGGAHGPKDGFDVQYTSPTRGAIAYGTSGALTHAGGVVDQHPTARWDSPWAKVGWDQWRYQVSAGGATLDLDFTAVAQTTLPGAAPSTTTTTAAAPTTGGGAAVTPTFTG